MSLATRCTACGTIFRIVEDQLRVSDGWVRCGRCAEVFDARELLFDIERDTPPAWPVPFTPGAVAEAPAPLPPPPPPPPPPPAPAPVHVEPTWAAEPEPVAPEPEPVAPPTWAAEQQRQEPRWVDEAPADTAAAAHAESPAMTAEVPSVVAPAVPEFMRRAERSERWQRPGVRLALGGVALLGVLALLLQGALHFRDALAALHPPARDTLVALCKLADCEVQPWRRIEALSIDATSLNPVGSGNSYRLNLSLRNKSATDVAAPWIELSLTDASGAPFARRVFGPEALSPALKQVGAESEQALSLSFSTGTQRVSGYSVNIFHP